MNIERKEEMNAAYFQSITVSKELKEAEIKNAEHLWRTKFDELSRARNHKRFGLERLEWCHNNCANQSEKNEYLAEAYKLITKSDKLITSLTKELKIISKFLKERDVYYVISHGYDLKI